MPKTSNATGKVPTGILVAIGGHENKSSVPEKKVQVEENYDPLEILKTFASLIKKENPVIEIITTASSQGEESYEDYLKGFAEIGITNLNRIHHDSRSQLLEDNLQDRINKADGFFFSGGDQLKLTSIYGGTDTLQQLKKRYLDETIVIAGTSAGAMALSTPMIYAGSEEVQIISGEIKITTGLEFLPDVCIDTHFVHRGRFIRMAQVIATNPACIGLGIEEDTGVIVRDGLKADVIGSGVVICLEGRNIICSNIVSLNNAVSIQNLNMHIYSKGDMFQIPQYNPPHITHE